MRNLHSPLHRFPSRAFRVTPRRCFAICAWVLCSCVLLSLLPARSQNTNPQVPQGGSATFDATMMQGPSSGCEILDPAGAVVASFPAYSSGGTANGWTLQINFHDYNALPGFTISAPTNAPLGTGYQVRTSAYYWSAGTAFFDVVAGNGTTPTPTPTSATPTPTPTYATPTPTSPTPTPTVTPTPVSGANPQVPQGGGNSFNAILAQGPSSGCEILDPQGVVVFSVSSSSGGSANGWSVQMNYNGYYELPGFTVSAPPNAPLGAGYVVRTTSYYWSAGTAWFDVVPGNPTTPTPTPTYSTPTPTSTSPTPIPTPTSVPLSQQPDAQIRNASESDTQWSGNDIYNSSGQNQNRAQATVPTVAAIYFLRVQNDSSAPSSLKISGPAGDAQWSVQYFDALTAGNSITQAVTAGGWNTPELAAGAWYELRVEVTPNVAVADDATKEVAVQASWPGDATHLDMVKTTTTRDRYIIGVQYCPDYTARDSDVWVDVPLPGDADYPLTIEQDGVLVFRAKWSRPYSTLPRAAKPDWFYWGKSGFGAGIMIKFEQLSQNATDLKEVSAVWGDEVTVKVKVIAPITP